MFSFEGDFKTRPKVSLGGASRKVRAACASAASRPPGRAACVGGPGPRGRAGGGPRGRPAARPPASDALARPRWGRGVAGGRRREGAAGGPPSGFRWRHGSGKDVAFLSDALSPLTPGSGRFRHPRTGGSCGRKRTGRVRAASHLGSGRSSSPPRVGCEAVRTLLRPLSGSGAGDALGPLVVAFLSLFRTGAQAPAAPLPLVTRACWPGGTADG